VIYILSEPSQIREEITEKEKELWLQYDLIQGFLRIKLVKNKVAAITEKK
jgi:hypothetical protein